MKQDTHKVSRAAFDRIAGPLRAELLSLQDRLKSDDFSVVVIFAGAAMAGKTEALNLLNEWLDPRWIASHAYGPPSDEERERPVYWRYWRDLPPKGQIGLYTGSWYHQPVQDFVYGKIDKRQFSAALDRIVAFERTLADEGTLIIKFWMHLDEALQKKRMKKLEKNPLESWRISKQDWKHFKRNAEFETANQKAIRKTDTHNARWVVVEGANKRYRSLKILTTLRDALRSHLQRRARQRAALHKQRNQAVEKRAGGQQRIAAQLNGRGAKRRLGILDRLDLSRTLTDEKYESLFEARRAELGDLCRRLHFEGRSAILVFEGADAAGKGGAIRRLVSAMDARDYRVIPVAKPTDEERAQHYLWRFWRHLPRAGRITIFDRSWYGRVLVERVEGLAEPAQWRRAYDEINEFEAQMVASGAIVLKFWIHISREEQYRRFKDRETNAEKAWKLTAEDWRNREKWDDYGLAVDEMVKRTSTDAAPWMIVEGEDKRYARIKVISTVIEALKVHLGPTPEKPRH